MRAFSLHRSFQKYISPFDKSGNFELNVIEAGCGHGCTMFPLLEEFSSLVYFATNYSPTAIQILESHRKYSSVSNRVKPFIWDIVEPAPCKLVRNIRSQFRSTAVWSVLCVFTLSAIHPRYHVSCLCNIAQVMRATIDESSTTAPPPLFLLFRDYGIHDMTMYIQAQGTPRGVPLPSGGRTTPSPTTSTRTISGTL